MFLSSYLVRGRSSFAAARLLALPQIKILSEKRSRKLEHARSHASTISLWVWLKFIIKKFNKIIDDSLLQIETDDFLKFMEALVVELSMNN